MSIQASCDSEKAVTQAIIPENIVSPILCRHCQYLNNLVTVIQTPGAGGYGRAQSSASLETLRQRTTCAVCTTLSRDLANVIDGDPYLQSLPASQIFVQSKGAAFLDNSYDRTYLYEHRYNSENAENIVLRLLLNIALVFPACGATEIPSVSELSSQVWETLTDSQRIQSEARKDLERRQITPQYCLIYSSRDPMPFLRIEPWEVPYFDVALLSHWVGSCDAHHGCSYVGVGSENTGMPSEFRVIDVRSMSIVKPSQRVRYVALSYVWQQAQLPSATAEFQLQRKNMKYLGQPGGLQAASLPYLLSDTIALCRDMGETFLWIDRLCIVQDDPETKHNLICAMDRIYREAAFTIVSAATGSGLQGYSGRPRKPSISSPPRDCKHEGGGVEPHHMEMLQSSPWNRRSWTFQERVLSRRCMFVTDNQVIWECLKGDAVEEYTWSINNRCEAEEYIQTEDNMSQFRGAVRDQGFRRTTNYNTEITESVDKYWSWVEDYTSRSLSFDTDILNAFSGVGNYLSRALGTHLLFALPESHFHKALLWSSLESPKARQSTPHIPSWSWASWKQAVTYEKFEYDDLVSLVFFHYQDLIAGQRQLNVNERWLGIDYSISNFEDTNSILDTSISMPNTAGKFMPAQWRSTKTWQECPHSPWQALKHKQLDPAAVEIAKKWPGALVFNTTVASLKLKFDDDSKGQTIRGVLIYSSGGELVGCMETSAASMDSSKCHDFVVICGGIADFRSRKISVQMMRFSGGTPDYDLWRLYVMRVEKLPSQSFVGRRIDVGYIEAHRWHLCEPRWETVVLC